MATDYGTDIEALTDLPDPEVLCSGERNAAHAQARRLLTPDGAMEDVGDLSAYDSLDLREWFGKRPSAADKASLDASVKTVLQADARARSVASRVDITAGELTVTSRTAGDDGPFGLVLAIAGVDSATLKVT